MQDMHVLAEGHILEGLKAGGWLQGEVQEMLDQRICALFMPHGQDSTLCAECFQVEYLLDLHVCTLLVALSLTANPRLWLTVCRSC